MVVWSVHVTEVCLFCLFCIQGSDGDPGDPGIPGEKGDTVGWFVHNLGLKQQRAEGI